MPKDFTDNFQTMGWVNEDVIRFLSLNGFLKTAAHCARVGAKAGELAEKFGIDSLKAEMAGYLHDVSVVIPNDEKIAFAQDRGLEILPEEASTPMILHQRLSAVLAQEVFGVRDEAVLRAVGCHTTLKTGATALDKVVFLADKIAWDQDSVPPYLAELLGALDDSLDAAVLVYLNYLWEMRETLAVVHPWFVQARGELMGFRK
jgi:predicted HD superfamily hydrolase involved in NAD metabolism